MSSPDPSPPLRPTSTPPGGSHSGAGRPTSGAPGSDPESQLPSVLARVLAFVGVFIGAGAGGLIGYAFGRLGGFEGIGHGAVTFIGAITGAGGVAVVAVLTLRAFGEWETIRRTGSRRG